MDRLKAGKKSTKCAGPSCRRVVRQPWKGRARLYCSNRCREKAYLRRKGSAATVPRLGPPRVPGPIAWANYDSRPVAGPLPVATIVILDSLGRKIGSVAIHTLCEPEPRDHPEGFRVEGPGSEIYKPFERFEEVS